MKSPLNIIILHEKTEEFVKAVKRVQNRVVASYQTFRLKEWPRKRFPQLVFNRPKLQTKSGIVYSDCLSKGSVAESFIDYDLETSQISQESGYALDIDGEGYTNIPRLLRHGQILREFMKVSWYEKYVIS